MALRLMPRREAIASIAVKRSASKRKATGTFFDLFAVALTAPSTNPCAAFGSISFV